MEKSRFGALAAVVSADRRRRTNHKGVSQKSKTHPQGALGMLGKGDPPSDYLSPPTPENAAENSHGTETVKRLFKAPTNMLR